MSLQIEVGELENGISVLLVHGEVDMSSSTEVRAKLSPLMQPGRKAILVNLLNVTYMDSSGIATLVEGLQQSMKLGIAFRLVELNPAVRDVFKLARLESVFQIYESVADAMSDL